MLILIAAFYVVVSVAAYITYAVDKKAAIKKRRRVSEKSLHLLALAGGWPGAWLAQQRLRHKTQKTPFRLVYWLTVALNLAILWGVVSLFEIFSR
ncbi:MAG: DUF1294 domain-containing protein [Halomonas sp.]|uniref:DUF1294 domain-containing protein n=1 Tax=unclassified Halomonas TaxID=2609666 RepID=UPI000990912F|nr:MULTISPECIES: DUF1294 domain-containing protein [unclassified Halomonas]AQU82141.1 cold-shock protein [Halomonas sp. 'Soap Lake \